MTASVAVNHAGMLGIMLAHIVMKAEASRTYLILASLEPLASGLVSSPVEKNEQSVVNQISMTDSHTQIHLSDSPHGFMISQTILSDLTPIMSDSYASNSKHKISWIADLQTTVCTFPDFHLKGLWENKKVRAKGIMRLKGLCVTAAGA